MFENNIVSDTEIKVFDEEHDVDSEYNVGASGLCTKVLNGKKFEIINCEVNKSNIANYAKESTNSNTSGVAGFIDADNITISDVDINDVEISTENGNLSGVLSSVIGNKNLSIRDINIDKMNLNSNAKSNNTMSITAGVIGYADIQNSTVENCIVTNSNIKGNGTNISGICGYSAKQIIVNNCEVNNSTITDELYDDQSRERARARAGIIATSTYGETSITNCKVLDTDIIGCGLSNAGIAGYVRYLNQLSDCTVENVNIITKICEIGSEYNYMAVAGGIASLDSLNSEINNCIVKNSTVETDVANMGGLIGTVSDSNKEIILKNCTIEGFTANNKNEIQKKNSSAGAVLGTGCAKLVSIDSTNNISKVNINIGKGLTEDIQVGGLIGCIEGSVNLATNNSITDIDIINGASGNIGGLIGIQNYDEANISELNIARIQIVSTGNGRQNLGGLIGFSAKLKMNNINIEDINIEANSANMIGGVLGIVNIDAILTNITINKSEEGLNNVVATQASYGGILLAFGAMKTDNININDFNINIAESGAIGTIGLAKPGGVEIKNITLEHSTIVGRGQIGGIVGYNGYWTSIIGCTVNNSIIKGENAPTGGIVGNNGEHSPITGCTINNSIITGGNAPTGGISGNNADHSPISNCQISESTVIGGNAPVGGIVGSNSSNSDISECTLSNVTLKGMIIPNIGEIKGAGSSEIIDCTVENVTKEENTGENTP